MSFVTRGVDEVWMAELLERGLLKAGYPVGRVATLLREARIVVDDEQPRATWRLEVAGCGAGFLEPIEPGTWAAAVREVVRALTEED